SGFVSSNLIKNYAMDQINATILKTTIEAIPVLNEENFSSWRTRITALFKLGCLKDSMINGEPALEDEDNSILSTLSTPKMKMTLKVSGKRSSNNSFPRSHLTKLGCTMHSPTSPLMPATLRSLSLKLGAVLSNSRIHLPASFDNIKQAITHSQKGDDIKPSKLFDHLEIHLNELKVSSTKNGSTGATMFTKEDTRCINGAHNPFAPNKKDRCWQLHPHLRTEHFKKNDEKNAPPLMWSPTKAFSLLWTKPKSE
ncbi:hypothetical protein VP01_7154g1, partial [Puccinia sorghi]